MQSCSCARSSKNQENCNRQNSSKEQATVKKGKPFKENQRNNGLPVEGKSGSTNAGPGRESSKLVEDLRKENEELRVLVRSMLNTFTDILQNILVRKSMNGIGSLESEYAKTTDSKL